jgi:hypothetical protein
MRAVLSNIRNYCVPSATFAVDETCAPGIKKTVQICELIRTADGPAIESAFCFAAGSYLTPSQAHLSRKPLIATNSAPRAEASTRAPTHVQRPNYEK